MMVRRFVCALVIALAAGSDVAASRDAGVVPTVIVRVDGAPRFLRTDSHVLIDGIAGTSSAIYDLSDGRYKERVSAGLASRQDGFDGQRRWSTDASGMPLIDDTLDGLLDGIVWARFTGRPDREHIAISALPSKGPNDRLRLRYGALSGPVDVTLDRRTRLIQTIDDFSGAVPTTGFFSDYRTVDGITLPFDQRSRSGFSRTTETLTRANPLSSAPVDAFAIPTEPADSVLKGTTTIPFAYHSGQIVIPIRIDDGPTLHVLFDSGSTNYVLPAVARRLRLVTAGHMKSGGFGPGSVAESYSRAGVLHIGSARVRGIPFFVLDDDTLGVDGVIGCEVLMRFVVRMNFENGTIVLADHARDIAPLGTPIPIRTGSCQAEVDASLDGIRGNAGIDTGSAWSVDIMTPFVRAHHLLKRYNATFKLGGSAIGGKTTEFYGVGRELQIGPFTFPDPDLDLGVMVKGAYADPTEMANIGLPLLRRFTVTFDYRAHRMWLRQNRRLDDIRLFTDWE